MSTSGTVELRPGVRLWQDGEVWSLVELGATVCTLRADQRIKTVLLEHLVASATVMDRDESATACDAIAVGLADVALANLSSEQRAAVEERARLVQGLIRPAPEDSRTMQQRLVSSAASSGFSVRTLERWMAGFREAGVSGLTDRRLTAQRRSSIDPRWDTAYLAVIRTYTAASTPTKGLVLDQVRRRLEEEHGAGVVPLPSRATAYRRLKESRGPDFEQALIGSPSPARAQASP